MLVSVLIERSDEVGVLGCKESVEKPGKMGHKRGNVGCKGKLFGSKGSRRKVRDRAQTMRRDKVGERKGPGVADRQAASPDGMNNH